MECNKDEALRAKGIAEQKVGSHEYEAAKKLLLKAQRLFPQLEGTQQLLAVIDVHLKAQVKLHTGEPDWYGILGAEPHWDDAAVKRQYRKLALVLHPDKNSSPGAEAAFKLVKEASAVLSDKPQREKYDKSRMSALVNPGQTRVVPSGGTNRAPSHRQQRHPNLANLNAFWTTCSHCCMHYQYGRNYVGCRLFCQSCKHSFVAHESGFPGPNGSNPAAPAGAAAAATRPRRAAAEFPQQHTAEYVKQMFEQSKKERVEKKQQAQPSVAEMLMRANRKTAEGNASPSTQQANVAAGEEEEVQKPDEKPPEERSSPQQFNCVNNSEVEHEIPQARKRKRLVEEEAGDEKHQHPAPPVDGSQPRRSTRRKRVISYNFDMDDDLEEFPVRKKTSVSEASHSECRSQASRSVQIEVDEEQEVEQQQQQQEPEPKPEPEPEPAPEAEGEQVPVYDFDEHRSRDKIKKGDYWMVYEELGPPRWYCRVEGLRGRKFQVRWLEPTNVNKEQQQWLLTGHYITCGEFQLMSKKDSRLLDAETFCQKIELQDGFLYPREGEVWAVFCDWSREWAWEDVQSRHYRYVAVEILSDYSGKGFKFARLRQVEERSNFFVRERDAGWEFCSPEELLKFSHRIPSVRVEHKLLPPGSLQLDLEAIENLVQ